MSVKDLSARLDERADAQLRTDVRGALAPLRKLLEEDGWKAAITITRGDTKIAVNCYDVMEYLDDSLFASLQQRRREHEVTEFLAVVDRLQGEVDELRDSIGRGE